VPKTPQNFRRRFAPIWTSENLSSKKVEGGFNILQILPKMRRGGGLLEISTLFLSLRKSKSFSKFLEIWKIITPPPSTFSDLRFSE
jgi:hypothetical protein